MNIRQNGTKVTNILYYIAKLIKFELKVFLFEFAD